MLKLLAFIRVIIILPEHTVYKDLKGSVQNIDKFNDAKFNQIFWHKTCNDIRLVPGICNRHLRGEMWK